MGAKVLSILIEDTELVNFQIASKITGFKDRKTLKKYNLIWNLIDTQATGHKIYRTGQLFKLNEYLKNKKR